MGRREEAPIIGSGGDGANKDTGSVGLAEGPKVRDYCSNINQLFVKAFNVSF